ncbi:MAG TPA: hypothetical protein VN872_11770, partial [Candidatus Acidoferrum sp.]|nr:hypothetical protein [Candidatus Acidoferrum sp.]
MIDRTPWKDYAMSEVERQYLDDYLADQKKKKDPNGDDAVFFARFCISQILKPRDLDVDAESHGYIGGDHDGGIDGFYFFVSGKLVTEEMEPSAFADHEGLTLSLELIQATR